MEITDTIETGKEYYVRRSEGWKWNGADRWWEYFVTFDGFNGAGGVWVTECRRWNGSSESMGIQPRSLSRDESSQLIEQVEANLQDNERAGA